MPIKSVFVLVISVFLTYTIAYADLWEQENTHSHQDSIAFQRSHLHPLGVPSPYTLSVVGVSLSFDKDVGLEVPFIGAFGYYRRSVKIAYVGREYAVNLGLLGSVEYADTSWADSFFGIEPPLDAKIFHLSAMIGTDVQTRSGTLVAAGGFTFHKTALGVEAILFGDGASGGGEYIPTALIAYFFHTATGDIANGNLSFYARYQKKRIMVGVTLGVIGFGQ